MRPGVSNRRLRARPLWLAALMVVCSAIAPVKALADCNGLPQPCLLPQGSYHILLPEGGTGPVPAVVVLHGFASDGESMIRNTRIVAPILARGYAVIAPDGQLRRNGRGRSWDFHPDRPATRDEAAFVTAVADHAAAQFSLARDKMILAGFSIGGSMASYIACARPEAFFAYAPLAGSFWQPHPQNCAGPVRLLHVHGRGDQTVPLTGREIRPDFVQGNVFDAVQLWRITNGCALAAGNRMQTVGLYTVQDWTDCRPGSDLRFVLHDGGHIIPDDWAQMMLDWAKMR